MVPCPGFSNSTVIDNRHQSSYVMNSLNPAIELFLPPGLWPFATGCLGCSSGHRNRKQDAIQYPASLGPHGTILVTTRLLLHGMRGASAAGRREAINFQVAGRFSGRCAPSCGGRFPRGRGTPTHNPAILRVRECDGSRRWRASPANRFVTVPQGRAWLYGTPTDSRRLHEMFGDGWDSLAVLDAIRQNPQRQRLSF